MARVSVEEVKAWAERTKLNVSTLDSYLLGHIEGEVLARLSAQVVTTTWLDVASTPDLIRTVISKKYFAFLYFKQYSEDVGTAENTYAEKVDANAEMLITGILDGSIIIPGSTVDISSPTFYPTDVSSATDPTTDDPSLGPAAFSMTAKY
jgi:hypothetical protein